MVGKLTPDYMLSASRIPALMGLSPYATQNELLKEMVDLVHNGIKPPAWAGNEATEWGNRLEPIVLAEAARRLNLKNVKLDHGEPFFHPTLELACSLDGTGDGAGTVKTDVSSLIYCVNAPQIDITGPGVLEAKVTSAFPEDSPPSHRGPLQLQAQMMCTGAAWGCIATLYRGIELRLFIYGEDEMMQRRIAEAVDDFERRKRDIDWYPVISSDDADVAFSNVDQGAPPLDFDALNASLLVSDLLKARADKVDAEDRIDAAQTAIKEIMGNHDAAIATVGNMKYQVGWGMRHYKAAPEKITPPKAAYSVRSKTLAIKELP